MRGALVKQGSGGFIPNYTVIIREKMTHIAYELGDTQLADKVRWAASTTDSSHPPYVPVLQTGLIGSPEDTAQMLSDKITALGGGASGQPIKLPIAVMPDIEGTQDPELLMRLYRAFRKRRGARFIFLTVEYHQAGWFSDDLVNALNIDPRFFILPQAYIDVTGTDGIKKTISCSPLPTVEDITSRGVDRAKVQPFLWFDRLDVGWDGWAFDIDKAQ